MSEFLSSKKEKTIAAALGSLIGLAAVTGCGVNSEEYKYEVGVVCENPSDGVRVESVDNGNGHLGKKTVDLSCKESTITSLELISSSNEDETTVNNGTDFNAVVSLSASGPDTRTASITLNVNPEENNPEILIEDLWRISNATVSTTESLASQG